jgi:signal transduction histidine kinase
MRSGRPEIQSAVPLATLDALALEPEHRALLARLDPSSYLIVPLVGRGEPLGTLTLFTTGRARQLGQDDLEPALEIARCLGLALANARRYRQACQRAEHHASLSEQMRAQVDELRARERGLTAIEERAASRDAELPACAETEAAVRLRDDLIATVSHDLKNPLTGIQGYSQLLRRRSSRLKSRPPAWMLESAGQIEALARQMSGMLDELLDLGRLQAGHHIELDRGQVDLVALARQAIEARRQAADGHEIRLEAAESAIVGWWDGRRLGRVLDNLLANALKYSRDGGEVVVRIGLADGGRTVELTVGDRGIGIPPEDLPHVFERFRRGGNAGGHVAGSGLGLASVRHIVEQHGGDVSIDSRLGVGTTVAVRLPLDQAEGEAGAGPAR